MTKSTLLLRLALVLSLVAGGSQPAFERSSASLADCTSGVAEGSSTSAE